MAAAEVVIQGRWIAQRQHPRHKGLPLRPGGNRVRTFARKSATGGLPDTLPVYAIIFQPDRCSASLVVQMAGRFKPGRSKFKAMLCKQDKPIKT
jgi:hypothetical protein